MKQNTEQLKKIEEIIKEYFREYPVEQVGLNASALAGRIIELTKTTPSQEEKLISEKSDKTINDAELKRTLINFVPRTRLDDAVSAVTGFVEENRTQVRLLCEASYRVNTKSSHDEIKREAESLLCYVEGDTAYFTTQPLNKQWGDDWNDAPYEHNAGTPYGYQSKDGWNIYTLKFDWDSEQPKDGHYNSPYSVEDINGGKVPWLKPSKWVKGGKNIYAGTTMQDFARLITSTGGKVYRQLYEGDYLYLTQSKEGGE